MPKSPNILVIMTDQQRFDSLGCSGCGWVRTPELDRLAAEGVRYESCYVNNPVCTPSRASLLTGKHINGHAVYQLHDILPEQERLVTVGLREKGYRTALIGKLHVSGRSFERDFRNPDDGFEVYEYAMTPHDPEGTFNSYGQWLKENHPDFYRLLREKGRRVGNIPRECHFTGWAAEKTIEFIESTPVDRPFFCLMSVVDPHDPYSDFPLEALEGIDAAAIPVPAAEPDDWNRLPEPVRREHEHSYLGGISAYDEEQIRRMRIGYYASIAFLDQQAGRVLEALKRRGIDDRTLVVFVSDHGDMLGDRGLLAKGAFMYDPAVRVPLIMRLPGRIPAGRTIDRLVQPHDLAATFLALAGFAAEEIEERMPGAIDLIGALEDPSRCRDHAVCLYRNTGISDEKLYFDPPIHGSMLRTGPWKLVCWHRGAGSDDAVEGELYHMERDPGECENLWKNEEYAAVRHHLMGRLMNWMVSSDVSYGSGRGGKLFPPRQQWSANNPL